MKVEGLYALKDFWFVGVRMPSPARVLRACPRVFLVCVKEKCSDSNY